MKKTFAELKKGDYVWVELPYGSGKWQKEKVTGVSIGEDGYEGSGRWYAWINTDKTVHTCPDELIKKEGKHWTVLIKSSIDVLSSYLCDANSSYKFYITTEDKLNAEKPERKLRHR